ncbi:serine/threonine protein kinase [Streptomyces sp. NRRL B-1140]|uniref:serine/threonine protein kinase n=1 Tax=Streptomyces sp. NRRL B-1140 TaxID=1415549 RepID=UPI0006AE35EE|nr:serine/threonine-protein kinase [Streptomyces sp. NRRL B-1140]KOX06031.1 serine/threonine protein kinase [Streptomyces sp. NRRL B-1140]
MAMGRAHVSTHQLVAGRYRLLEIIHRETNRICWYAEDTGAGEISRPCLVTQIGLPEDPHGAERRAAARLLRTTENMALLCPGRIAAVVDAVEEAGALWTVNEWIDGTALGELLSEQGTFNYVRAARIGLELLDVLDAAHAEGITHGELSPGQVFVREDHSVVVTGFGLAGATLAPRLTAPAFASPEQARDQRIGPAADLWALGAILYTTVEGRPPFRDRGRPENTLKGVDRLPLRTPVRAGPLTQVVQGLLRKDSRERLTRPVVREALTRALSEDPDAALAAAPVPRLRGAYAAVRTGNPAWSRRTVVAGTALAVVTVAVAVLAATQGLPGTDGGSDAAESPARPPASAATPGEGTGGGSAEPSGTPSRPRSPSTTPSPSSPPAAPPEPTPTRAPSSPSTALPPGFQRYRAAEGFSVALPKGFERLDTDRDGEVYRVVFGAEGDDRTLAVTYSDRAGPDPVAVWRDDVEPNLKQADGYDRVGSIRATTYQGRKAADMEWTAYVGGDRVHTYGRGFLLGGGRSFSLRWTTPDADWDKAANQEALRTFFTTFRPDSD